jgi:hypothetical protein
MNTLVSIGLLAGELQVPVTKRGKQWVTSRVSFDSDGTKGSQTAMLTVGEKTHAYEIENRTHGDKILPDKKLVFRKTQRAFRPSARGFARPLARAGAEGVTGMA